MILLRCLNLGESSFDHFDTVQVEEHISSDMFKIFNERIERNGSQGQNFETKFHNILEGNIYEHLCGSSRDDEPRLHRLVRTGKLEDIESLLERSSAELVFTTNNSGETPLHIAAECNRSKIVRYFLSLDVDVERLVFMMCQRKTLLTGLSPSGTALHKTSDPNVANLLICAVAIQKRSELIFQRNDEGETALNEASTKMKGLPMMKFLLAQVPKPIDLMMVTGLKWGTALHQASTEDQAKLLLDTIPKDQCAPFIFKLDANQRSALHTACANGNVNVAALLLEHGSHIAFDPCQVETNPKTILAGDLTPTTISEVLLTMPDNKGNTPLMLAINSGSVGLATGLFKFMEDTAFDVQPLLKHRNMSKQNIFHLAARHLDGDCFSSLLREYLSEVQMDLILMRDNSGNNPLHYAVAIGNIAIFANLLFTISLQTRRVLLMQPNIHCVAPLAIANRLCDRPTAPYDKQNEIFVLKQVMNDDISVTIFEHSNNFARTMPRINIQQLFKHGGKLPCQPKILNVLKHSILIYSLLDKASTLLNHASTSRGHIKHDEVSSSTFVVHHLPVIQSTK